MVNFTAYHKLKLFYNFFHNLAQVRDPRWGRAQEVYSEDPCLSAGLTIGYVTGGQGAAYNGTPYDNRYMLAGACCKHYAA